MYEKRERWMECINGIYAERGMEYVNRESDGMYEEREMDGMY